MTSSIHAAIERHRRTAVVFEAVIDEVRKLEDSILPSTERPSPWTPTVTTIWKSTLTTIDGGRITASAAITELDNAGYGLCEVHLTSTAGLVELCEYVNSLEEWELPDDFHIAFVVTLPDMLKGLPTAGEQRTTGLRKPSGGHSIFRLAGPRQSGAPSP